MPPAVAALIRELSEKGATTVKIARVAGVSVRTVERYRNGRRPEMLNPLYDPRRDGMYEGDLTASICGDPPPGRRELIARGHGRTLYKDGQLEMDSIADKLDRVTEVIRRSADPSDFNWRGPRHKKDLFGQCPPPKTLKTRQRRRRF